MLVRSMFRNILGESRLRWLLLVVVSLNVFSAVYVLRGGGRGALKSDKFDVDDGVDEEEEEEEHGGDEERFKRSDYFDREARGTKLIHLVREESWQWSEAEDSSASFARCPNYRNCRLQTSVIAKSTRPGQIPNTGNLVIFTAQALRLHRTSTFWLEASSLRQSHLDTPAAGDDDDAPAEGRGSGHPPLWAVLAMRSPFELNLDFLTAEHDDDFAFNLTMSYKPDSDVFVPVDFWSWDDDEDGQERQLHPKVSAAGDVSRQADLLEGKTRKVLWMIDGPCKSVNNRMRYALELSRHIAVDIAGRCEYSETLPDGRTVVRHREINAGTHRRNGNDDDDGAIGDVGRYKFALAMEDISCRDYVTEQFFRVARRMDVLPIVMGAQRSAYELLSPPGSFLHIDDFPGGPRELARELRRLDGDDAAYAAFFRHRGRGGYRGAPVSALCRLCDLLNFVGTGGENVDVVSVFGHRDAADFAELWTPDDCNTNSLYHQGKEKDLEDLDNFVAGDEAGNNNEL